MSTVAPGWYADPASPHNVRWWDGQQWTNHVQPLAQPPVVVPQPQPVAPEAESPQPSRSTLLTAEQRMQQQAHFQAWEQQTVPQPGNERRKRRIPTAVLVVIIVVGLALIPAGYFGSTHLVGAASAAQKPTPAPTPTQIPPGADLATPEAPSGITQASSPPHPDTVVADELGIESAEVEAEGIGDPSCYPLRYSSPIINGDTKSTDPLQLLPVYASTTTPSLILTASARQFTTTQAAGQEQSDAAAIASQCEGSDSADDTAPHPIQVSTVDVHIPGATVTAWAQQIQSPANASVTVETLTADIREDNRVVRAICATSTKTSQTSQECTEWMTELGATLAHAEHPGSAGVDNSTT